MRAAVDAPAAGHHIERRIARRLARLRAERGWSLEDVAERTAISLATLSRLERSELSPTAAMLGTLCALYGWTLSRLMAESRSRPGRRLETLDHVLIGRGVADVDRRPRAGVGGPP